MKTWKHSDEEDFLFQDDHCDTCMHVFRLQRLQETASPDLFDAFNPTPVTGSILKYWSASKINLNFPSLTDTVKSISDTLF